jgi:hypothetical protein
MSMIGNFRRAQEARIEALLREPEGVTDFLYEDETDASDEGSAYADFDVDKAWHGIHFLLTGTAWEGEAPLDFIVQGGQPIGEVDVGYGPARAFTAAEVRDITAALRAIDGRELERRFDPAAMQKLQIYPTIWDRPREEDDTLGYLVTHYEALRDFLEGAAERGEGLIVYIN